MTRIVMARAAIMARRTGMAPRITRPITIAADLNRICSPAQSSIHDDRFAHAHLLVEEVATVGLVGARGGREGDGAGLVRRELNLAFGRGAGKDSGALEEARRGEIMAAA